MAISIAATAAAPPIVRVLNDGRFFFRAKDGTILTLVMLELLAGRGGAPAYVAAATVEEAGRQGQDVPGASVRAVPLKSGPGPAMDRNPTFFGQIYLQSGRNYLVRYVVNDGAGDEMFLKSTLVGVPHLSGGFSASSVVPAERFGPASPGDGPSPFHVGSEEVVPKAGGVFRRSEALKLYLQVYDARVDSVTSLSRVDVVFRFYRVIKGASKRYGKPASVLGAAGLSLGLELPISDWPPGSYRVVVALHDRIAAAHTSTEGSFSIVGD